VAARTLTGVAVAVVGIIAFLIAGVNFNTLFFQNYFTRVEDVPAYAQIAVLPFLVAVLLLFDASFILGLKRAFSLSAHIVGTIVWIWASYSLYANLLTPVRDLEMYRPIFLGFLFAIVMFVVGIIVNDIRSGKKEEYPAK
jgi:hypothetical protein